MRRSTTKILTTHVGSLPGRGEAASAGQLPVSADISAIIAAQQETGLDIVNEGEFTKGGDWLSYIDGRLSGFEVAKDSSPPLIGQGRDREVFGDFYRYAAERGTLFYVTQKAPAVRRNRWVCTGPIAYAGQATLQKELDLYRQSIAGNDLEDYFLTTTAPASLEPYHTNAYYKTTEEFVFALAEAMRAEYEMIANAGFIVQVDDAWLVALWDRIGVKMGLDAFIKYCSLRVAALNHALRNIPEERIRYHLCWGSWHGPHAFDIPLYDIVDVLLRVKAQGYLIEGANARHEHEYHVWENVRLPKGKILIPGVVAHATDTIEHPELVSERIQRYARLVGKENVIAGTDCGFGERTHAQIAWAKLRALVDGAALATQALKFN